MTNRPPTARDTHLPSARSVVVTNVDGTHMGLAVNWWSSAIENDRATTASLRSAFPAPDVLRSAVEVVLAQATWLTRASCFCTFASDCDCADTVGATLRELASTHLVDPLHRQFCSGLADVLEPNPDATDLRLDPIPVTSLMSLVVFLGSVIEYRYGVPVASQIESYRIHVLEIEGSR